MSLYMSPIIAFIIALVLTPIIIPVLTRLKFGQSIREIGPSWHNKKKGTPTMGGVVIITSAAIALLINWFELDRTVFLALICAVGFGAIGFADDFIKVIFKRNLGLRAWQKSALQLIISIVFVFAGLSTGTLSTFVNIPFTGYLADFSWVFIPFAVFAILSTVNAVNLTDGIDGLASSVTIIVFLFFGAVTHPPASPLAVFCYTIAAAVGGFLVYNKYPARVFMGDTGSLFLGGAVAIVALLQQNPFVILFVGIIYVVETLSVVIQVASFKLTGKRVFKMSPLHHHFEMCGWSEKRIVAVFSAVTVVTAFISYVMG